MLEYLGKIKMIVDDIASVGDVTTYHEYMNSLESLPRDSDSVIALVESRLPNISIEEVECLILAQELHLKKCVKFSLLSNSFVTLVNLTHGKTSQSMIDDDFVSNSSSNTPITYVNKYSSDSRVFGGHNY